jgi:hypothetical protein
VCIFDYLDLRRWSPSPKVESVLVVVIRCAERQPPPHRRAPLEFAVRCVVHWAGHVAVHGGSVCTCVCSYSGVVLADAAHLRLPVWRVLPVDTVRGCSPRRKFAEQHRSPHRWSTRINCPAPIQFLYQVLGVLNISICGGRWLACSCSREAAALLWSPSEQRASSGLPEDRDAALL